MKRFIKILGIITIISIIAILSFSCAKDVGEYTMAPTMAPPMAPTNENEFSEITEYDFIETVEESTSTFSLDVNTAAYSNLRSYIMNGHTIKPNQVRIEEMVNYFQYDYPEPAEGEPLSITTNIFPCPWNNEAKLLTIGLKTEEIEMSEMDNNIVFLLDVSGSMDSPDKIDLMQSAFRLLVNNLNNSDTISIVTYSSGVDVALEGASGEDKNVINNIITGLSASGSTAGANGIQTAYEIAERYFKIGGNNRVILATDGDFNVGINTQSGLEDFIAGKRDTGIYLTVLGFGYGNLKDNKLETLANNGNGNYAYIDTISEAEKVLVEELNGTLNTVARDAKAQVEFNPAKVNSYRLLGYENKLLTNEEWENTETDSGELGAGFTVTAVYEIVLMDNMNIESTMEDNFLKASVRYKDPDITQEEVKEQFVYADEDNITLTPNEDMLFISAVVETGLILRISEYKGTADLNNVLTRLNGLTSVETDQYRAEFKDLIEYIVHDYD